MRTGIAGCASDIQSGSHESARSTGDGLIGIRVRSAGQRRAKERMSESADVEGARTVGIRALLADGDYDDARGMTVLAAAETMARG